MEGNFGHRVIFHGGKLRTALNKVVEKVGKKFLEGHLSK